MHEYANMIFVVAKPSLYMKGGLMWYVIQVIGGHEQKVLNQIEKIVDSQTYKQVFIPSYEIKKRYAGTWQLRREVLFPGYVFVETKTPDVFRGQLHRVPSMARILTSGDEQERYFIPLTDEEKTVISAFIGDDDFVMRMSEGVIEGDEVVILKGPLMHWGGVVKKIDRHKRLAYLEIPMFGRLLTIKAGLEIIKKN